MIRLILGFIFVFTGVGTLDYNPNAPLYYGLVSVIGLALMFWPVADGTFEEYK